MPTLALLFCTPQRGDVGITPYRRITMSLEFSQELDTPIISPTFAPQDAGEIGLRPKLLSDYTGQEKAKGNLSIYIEAARRRNEPLDQTLL